jgi:L,D-peptidoglycan transpeptidase YkuD (ErfK/YbiS/YcfS/YnhG family)
MELVVEANGRAQWNMRAFRCAIGRGGIRADKREGDGATPAGVFALRRVLYRPDRLTRPATGLPAAPLDPADGWCDDPADPLYNRPVRLPYPARHERLWREDAIYDVIVVLGHNDDPVIPGRGSAVFLHVAAPDFGPTQGCVALAREELMSVLATAGPGDMLRAIAAPA